MAARNSKKWDGKTMAMFLSPCKQSYFGGNMITFVKEKMYGEQCYGGIETTHCSHSAVWYELFDGWQIIARLCEGCKDEVETYVLNQSVSN
jgi:hypothetical protein